MLKPEDNEKITRVGPGTPCGELFRRYWTPAAMSSELPEKDGAPLRVRLLGRRSDRLSRQRRRSRAHRRLLSAPPRADVLRPQRRMRHALRLSRLEIRSSRRLRGHAVGARRHAAAGEGEDQRLSVRRAGGIVWTYMGPKDQMPAPPDYEWTRAPATHRYVSKTFEDCNYLQAMEGGLDTAHSSFAHNNNLGDKNEMRLRDRSPRLDVERTDYGYYYVSTAIWATGAHMCASITL